ncbi:MAG: transporter substrate-binding domain-containing protein [Polaromonas sp.]|uniref:transporter substrate-binding domain-containing protein n=1 Tax=Polaromonas sp. TaxID=1869339 RepID=UPI00248801D9|nr:transporter substrate-binding domain-containing protein [Polaromonas sp.]MDI1269213.1 transporter substrate-binding domain-containing protein [Polaromonas sp.]
MFKTKSLIAAALVCVAPLFAHADKLADIKSKGVVRIATTIDAPPWGFTDSAGKPTGLDVELAENVAKRLGVKLELQQVTGANRIPYLLSNKVDVVIASLGSSPERAKLVSFSKPYAAVFLGVYGGKGVPKFSKVADLAGQTIAVPKGSTPDLSLTEMAPSAKLIRFEDTASVISAFLSGQAPMFAENNFIAQKVAEDNPAKGIEMKSLIRISPAFMAVQPGETALLAEMNKIIDAKVADGSLAALRLKWFKDEQKELK